MKKDYKLKVELLNAKAFLQYGDVLSIESSESVTINDGYAQKHQNLCTLDTREKGGETSLHIYLAKARQFPIKVNILEKHPFFSQTFMPRSTKPFLVIVALGGTNPELATLKVFKTNGNQGVHYRRGIWHFPLTSLEDDAQFIVLDRSDKDKKLSYLEACIEHYFSEENIVINSM